MNYRDYLNSVSGVFFLSTTVLSLGGCGGSSSASSSQGGVGINVPLITGIPASENHKMFKISEVSQPSYMVFVFNGFNASSSSYSRNHLNLAGDLSAIAPENLYWRGYYKDAVGYDEKEFPLSSTPKKPVNYNIKLPASKVDIETTPTFLNPGFAMSSDTPEISQYKDKLIPTSDNPVLLSIPAGIQANPEAPFFPAGTRYTAVLAEKPRTNATTGEQPKDTAVISIESSQENPVTFGAFAHYQVSNLNLRFYDRSSTVDTAKPNVPLLSKLSNPGVIKARFLSLTSDNLPSMDIQSMDQETFSNLGMESGHLLTLMRTVFPKLVVTQDDFVYPMFNLDHGIFCLGGNNTFNKVNLSHQTFLYPVSNPAANTQVKTVMVSNDSGFIVESGLRLTVNTIQGDGTLKLIAVMGDIPTTPDGIIQADTLNGVTNVDVVLGRIRPGFKLPEAGMVLLSHTNELASPISVHTQDVHIGGSFYNGESEYKDKKVILTSLVKKSALNLGSGSVSRLLAHHPETQGMSRSMMEKLYHRLNPMTHLKSKAATNAAAGMLHGINTFSNAFGHSSAYITSLGNALDIAISNDHNQPVFSANFNWVNGPVRFVSSVCGSAAENKESTTLGANLTASSPIRINGMAFIPSVAVGYSLNTFDNIYLNAEAINIALKDAALNSVFMRCMSSIVYAEDNLTFTLAAGLEANYSAFSKGTISSNDTRLSIANDTLQGCNTVVEANLLSSSAQFKIGLWNFNQFHIQYGINY